MMSQQQYHDIMSNLLKEKCTLASLRAKLEGNVRATRAEHSRRFLSLNYAIEYVTTHLQEIPQRIR